MKSEQVSRVTMTIGKQIQKIHYKKMRCWQNSIMQNGVFFIFFLQLQLFMSSNYMRNLYLRKYLSLRMKREAWDVSQKSEMEISNEKIKMQCLKLNQFIVMRTLFYIFEYMGLAVARLQANKALAKWQDRRVSKMGQVPVAGNTAEVWIRLASTQLEKCISPAGTITIINWKKIYLNYAHLT